MAKDFDQPLAYRVVRSGVWSAASSYLNIAFGFFANLALTRLLSPEHFGIFALATFFFALVNARTKLSIGYAFAQHPGIDAASVGSHLVLDVILGIGSLFLAVLAVPLLHTLGYSWDVAWGTVALGCIGVLDAITNTARILLERELNFKQTSLVTSLVFPLSYLPAFWLALNGGGYWSLVAQNGAFALFLLVGMWWTARRRLPTMFQWRWRFDHRVAVQFVRFGAVVGIGTLAGTLFNQFDNFLVGTFVGVAMLGYYDRAYRIAQWPGLLLSPIVQRVAFYTYARLQDDPTRLAKTVTMILWLVTTVGLAIALAIFAAAPDLVLLLYGERWMTSAIFVRFLVVYALLGPLTEIVASLFIAVGQPLRTSRVWALQLFVLILAGTPLTVLYGTVGTCIGVGIAQVLGLLIAYRQLSRMIALRWCDLLATPMLAVAIALMGYLTLTWNLDLNSIALAVRVLFKAGFIVTLFLIIIMILQPKTSLERIQYVWRLWW
jgi:PST family polysaccharide transporter